MAEIDFNLYQQDESGNILCEKDNAPYKPKQQHLNRSIVKNEKYMQQFGWRPLLKPVAPPVVNLEDIKRAESELENSMREVVDREEGKERSGFVHPLKDLVRKPKPAKKEMAAAKADKPKRKYTRKAQPA